MLSFSLRSRKKASSHSGFSDFATEVKELYAFLVVSSGGFTSQHRFAVCENRRFFPTRTPKTPRRCSGPWPASRLQSPQPTHLFV